MDFSSDPLHDPLGSSPPTNDSLDLGELPNRAPSPTLASRDQPSAISTTLPFQFDSFSSSDPLRATDQSFQFPAATDRLQTHLPTYLPTRLPSPLPSPLPSRLQSRKRGPSSLNPLIGLPNKEPRFSQQNTTNYPAQELVL